MESGTLLKSSNFNLHDFLDFVSQAVNLLKLVTQPSFRATVQKQVLGMADI